MFIRYPFEPGFLRGDGQFLNDFGAKAANSKGVQLVGAAVKFTNGMLPQKVCRRYDLAFSRQGIYLVSGFEVDDVTPYVSSLLEKGRIAYASMATILRVAYAPY